jgi:hypothetical protein
MMWNLDQIPELKGRNELSEAHRLYDAGDIDAAYEAFKPLFHQRRRNADTEPACRELVSTALPSSAS